MPQITALDTNTTYVDPVTGAPKLHNCAVRESAGEFGGDQHE